MKHFFLFQQKKLSQKSGDDEEDDEPEAEGGGRKITKFTVIATLIMWMVNRPSLDDIYVQRARNYLQSLIATGKSRKNLNEKEKFSVKQSDCEYNILRTLSFNFLIPN